MPVSRPHRTIGYCTNVHAGVDVQTIRNNLLEYAIPARTAAGLDELGVGLWIPSQAASELAKCSDQFAEFLAQHHLKPFTINGFPYDNFHQEVVKRRVYRPTWWQIDRLEYTKQLADILATLLPESEPLGSISTLPIGWPTDLASDKPQAQSQLNTAGRYLRELAQHLERLQASTGREIVVAIEPEPGCVLDTSDDMIAWFDQHLPDPMHRKFITVCHDICHSAVMMESQTAVLDQYQSEGIKIGKVQVSNAIVADWDSMAKPRQREAVVQLSQFAEDRYLHQTGRKTQTGEFRLAEDLPDLIGGDIDPGDAVQGDQKWVVHFHVPIFLERFGHLTTSQNDVVECLKILLNRPADQFTGHYEIETYAWTVLPETMRKRGLAEDIASEFKWLRQAIAESL